MSAEKIIQLINKDAESEIKNILDEAKKQAKIIIENSKKEAKKQAEIIISNGEKNSENIKRILIAKANQETKHEIMNTKETIIGESLSQAYSEITKIKEENYKIIITKLMKNSIKKIGEDCKIFISRDIDKVIANNLNLTVIGSIDAAGGFIAVSNDGKIKLDNTFDAIMKRKNDKIREKVGKTLFS